VNLCILTCFFQLLSVAPLLGSGGGSLEGISGSELKALLLEFEFLLGLYASSSEHESLAVSVSKQAEVVCFFILFIIRLATDNVSGDPDLLGIIRRLTASFGKVIPQIEKTEMRSDLCGKLGKLYYVLIHICYGLFVWAACVPVCMYPHFPALQLRAELAKK
jgi:hypothetical protein